jgi:hypothetical protein
VKQSDIEKALAGHKNALEILEVLNSPVEEYEMADRKQGYVVGNAALFGAQENAQGNALACGRKDKHWMYGFDPEGHKRHNERQKDRRARHGLQFLERPNRKGRFIRMGAKTRAKVREQYNEQVKAEENGENWQP